MCAATAQGASHRPRPSAIWRAVRIFGWLCSLAAIGLAVRYAPKYLPHKAIAVRTALASQGTVRDVVSSSNAGEVTPQLHATLRSEIAGRVILRPVESGQKIKKGSPILHIDPTDVEARLRQAQATLYGAQAQRAQSDMRLTNLRRQADRARLLAQRGAGPVQASEDANAAVAEALVAVQAADGTRAQALAAMQVARVQRGRADIYAPFDGLLTDVMVNVGDTLTLAAPVAQIIDDSRLHVDATIDEADAARVQVGQVAELHLDALPGHTIAGRVARVDPVIKRDLKGARTLTVEVEVAGVDAARAAGLKPGMSANVEIIVAEKQDVLWVPSNVIVGRGVNRYVYVLEPEEQHYRAHRRVVEVGLTNWERSEIISGLKKDALLVTSLNEKGLDDGALVDPQKPQPATEAGGGSR